MNDEDLTYLDLILLDHAMSVTPHFIRASESRLWCHILRENDISPISGQIDPWCAEIAYPDWATKTHLLVPLAIWGDETPIQAIVVYEIAAGTIRTVRWPTRDDRSREL